MKLLFYSPDSYGLGHVRRSISIASALLARQRGASGLVLTGAPRAHYFDYPDRCDYLKLPSVTKDRAGNYVSRDLDMDPEKVIRLREGLIWLAAANFSPDLFVVDHSPMGLGGEVVPTLMRLAAGPEKRTLRVLGLRDIIDDPLRVRAAWKRSGTLDVLRSGYDLILVYGDRDVFDPISAYGIPPDIERKTRFVGYLPRPANEARCAGLRARYAPRTNRLVVATSGGGGDGNKLLSAFVEGYARLADPGFDALAITGPLMSSRKRKRLVERAEGIKGLTVEEYVDCVPELFRAADLVVSMGGYNTVCELASTNAKALIVPRIFPRREQWLRARLLEQRGVARCIEPDKLTADTLISAVHEELAAGRPGIDWGLSFEGLERATKILTGGFARASRGAGATVAWGRC